LSTGPIHVTDIPVRPPSTRRGRHVRFAVDASAIVHAAEGDYPCMVEDLSRSGVRLSGPLPPALDRILDLTLRSSRSEPELRLRARPARRTDDVSGTVTAFEFLDVAPDQHRGIDRLVESGVVRAAHPSTGLEALRPSSSIREIRAALESIPLPQRIGLATRAGKKEREALRHDTHAAVLDALARNPNLSAPEARALAASPHLAAGTLDAFAADGRFVRDDDMRLAIIGHPRASHALVEHLVAEFDADHARRLLRRPGLAPQVRERLSRRVARGH
jgi:hypothetical protein